MPGVTIWALESDHDKQAIKCLAEKLVAHQQLGNVSIRAVGKRAIKPRRGQDPAQSLKGQVELYLLEDDCVIFVIDSDGLMAAHQRQQEPNSFINQVKQVSGDKELAGRVHFVLARQELEAWLLIDCVGVFCYFASKRKGYKENCRATVGKKEKLASWIKKHQRGNTELIVEAYAGAKGVKECLVEFSKEILLKLNPEMPRKNVKEEKYRESLSPKIAQHVEISDETLGRNASLQRLGQLIAQCCKQ